MKNIILTIALVFTLAFSASAQSGRTDAFYNDWDGNNDRFDIGDGFSFVLPGTHGNIIDTNSTPVGSGLFILGALGAGYALSKRRRRK